MPSEATLGLVGLGLGLGLLGADASGILGSAFRGLKFRVLLCTPLCMFFALIGVLQVNNRRTTKLCEFVGLRAKTSHAHTCSRSVGYGSYIGCLEVIHLRTIAVLLRSVMSTHISTRGLII